MLNQYTDVAIPSRHRDVTVKNVLRSNRRNGQRLTSASASTDLSAVFNTDHHDIIKRRWMSMSFGIIKESLQLFDCYLKDRMRSLFLLGDTTISRNLTTGLQQGSILWPLLFTLCTYCGHHESYPSSRFFKPRLR